MGALCNPKSVGFPPQSLGEATEGVIFHNLYFGSVSVAPPPQLDLLMATWTQASPHDLSRRHYPLTVLVAISIWLMAASALGEIPATVSLTAQILEPAQKGTVIAFDPANYPAQSDGGWFAIAEGNESGAFSFNESTGVLAVANPEVFNAKSVWDLTIEHGNLQRADQERIQAKLQFLQAAGLSERDICRELGLVTRYSVTIGISPQTHAPAFPKRPWHFLWPMDRSIVGTIQAQDADPGDQIRYRILHQDPPECIVIDANSGELKLNAAKPITEFSSLAWKGTIEATDSFGKKSTATVWITPPFGFPTLGFSAPKIEWPRNQFEQIAERAKSRIEILVAKAEGWRADLRPSSQSPQAYAPDPLATTMTENPAPTPQVVEATPLDAPSPTGAEWPSENASVAGESASENAGTFRGTEWAAWAVYVLKMALLLFVFFTYQNSRAKASAKLPAEVLYCDDMPPEEIEFAEAQLESLTDWPLEPEFELKRELEADQPADLSDPQLPFPTAQFEWEDQQDRDNLEEERQPDDEPIFGPSNQSTSDWNPSQTMSLTPPRSSTSEGVLGSGSDQAHPFPAEFGGAGFDHSATVSFTLPEVQSPAAVLREAAQAQELPLELLLPKPEEVQADTQSATTPAPSQQELETLLSMLDQKYSIRRAAGEEPKEAPPEPKKVEIPPAPAPAKRSAEMDSTDSISDYMNNLLAKYSKKSSPTAAPMAPAPVAVVEVEQPAPAQPVRKSRPIQPGVIPSPVHTCDVKTTRTQLELLRETSNLTAAHAIRTASTRRRRKNLVRGMMFLAVGAVLYALRLVVLG